jgi:tRNA A-37 threonylcarbamoyl transferase component Bud32
MKVCPTCGLKYPDEHARCFVDKAELQPVPDPRIGTLLKGRYMIEAALGEGGMAIVYRARNTLVERPVAVKVMNPHLAKDVGLKERFRREAKNAAAVAHPNIIDIYDYGETDDGTPFLVMELLDGQPLNHIVEKGPIPASEVAALGVQVARGLARAHDFSVIHRDLKPENIFISKTLDGGPSVAKILDFGIARSMNDSRLTNMGEIFGTPQYMAPERVTTTDAGASADLYALGVILFEMATGRLPFESDDVPGFFIKHLQDPPPRPSELVAGVPPALEALILSLLAKKPEERPVDAHAVMRALESLAPKQPAPPPIPRPATAHARTQVAPTLPPTTLERWGQRAAVFDQMMHRAFPSGTAPPMLIAGLAELRGILARLGALRANDLEEQRKLERLEAQAQEGRERLGHAVHVLAEDLSSAREAQRAAHRQMAPYLDADREAEQTYQRAQQGLAALGGDRVVEEPSAALAQAAREMAEALDRWRVAFGAGGEARRWMESKDREVSDLEFQVEALRAQLERVESAYENERGASEAVLLRDGDEVARLEQRLTQLGSSITEPLRARHDLGDLFAQLEQEGTPAAGIARG